MSNEVEEEEEEIEILVQLRLGIEAMDLETHDFQDEQVGLNLHVGSWEEVEEIHKAFNQLIKQWYKD